jgi:hypothetical protein
MEEHQLPVHEEPAIVASNKKHSWSKKEKLALYVAGVFALVGIGFGGYTFYNQVILNAAGEDSLGADAGIDLPQPTTSPYFKIVSTTQQSVDIALNGEASNWPTTAYDGTMPAQGWRVEMTEDTTAESGWKTVVNEQQYVGTALQSINYNYNTSTKSIDDPSLLQPGKVYYFRVMKKTALTDPNSTWEQQGPALLAQTTEYPSFTLTNSEDQVKVVWTATQKGQEITALQGDRELAYGIARTKNLSLLAVGSSQWTSTYSVTDTSPKQLANINYLRSGNGTKNENTEVSVVAGEGIINQAKNSTYYYAPVLYKIDWSSNGGGGVRTIVKLLGSTKAVAAGAVSGQLLATVNVPVTSFAWNKVPESLKVSVALNDKNISNTADIYTYLSLESTKNRPVNLGVINKSVTSTNPLKLDYSVTQPSGAQYQWPAGDYILTTDVYRGDVTPSVTQSVRTPIKLTQAVPGLGATYKSASVKKGATVSITITNPTDARGPQRPTGTVIVKNHKTGKTIKSFKLTSTTAKQTIKFKATTKGSYSIDVVYTADSASAPYFQNKTINLPKLTVK